MKSFFLRLVLWSSGMLVLGPVAALHAQLSRIFVAAGGNDANDGSRGAPKRNFQPAHDAVATGGDIVVLDTAGYGALNITKSVSVTVPPGVNGFVTVSGNTKGVNINAGAGSRVALRGLVVEGSGSGSGIFVGSAGGLTLENCTVSGFNAGINVSSTAVLTCSLSGCAARGCALGLSAAPGSAVTVFVRAHACQFDGNNDAGVFASASTPGSSVDVHLIDCALAGNSVGVFAASTNAVVRLNNCDVSANATGLSASSGGAILSRSNNTLEKNPSGNTFTGTYSAK